MGLRGDDSGAVLVEYAVVLALLSFAFMSGMIAIELAANTTLTTLQNGILNYGLRNLG